MGRIKQKTVAELMDIVNRFVDGEDACHNKRTKSPEDDDGAVLTDQLGTPRGRCDEHSSKFSLSYETKV
jgi:hypothetical protein